METRLCLDQLFLSGNRRRYRKLSVNTVCHFCGLSTCQNIKSFQVVVDTVRQGLSHSTSLSILTVVYFAQQHRALGLRKLRRTLSVMSLLICFDKHSTTIFTESNTIFEANAHDILCMPNTIFPTTREQTLLQISNTFCGSFASVLQ